MNQLSHSLRYWHFRIGQALISTNACSSALQITCALTTALLHFQQAHNSENRKPVDFFENHCYGCSRVNSIRLEREAHRKARARALSPASHIIWNSQISAKGESKKSKIKIKSATAKHKKPMIDFPNAIQILNFYTFRPCTVPNWSHALSSTSVTTVQAKLWHQLHVIQKQYITTAYHIFIQHNTVMYML